MNPDPPRNAGLRAVLDAQAAGVPDLPPGQEQDEQPRLAFIDAVEFLKQEFPAPPWLVQNMLPAGGCSFIAGAPKSTKSWLALDLAFAVATGGDFLGRPVENPGAVLLVDAETPPQQLQERIRQIAAGRYVQSDALARLRILKRKRLDLADLETIADLQAAIAEHEPVLIVVDPLKEFHARDENSASEMSPILGNLRELTTVCGSALALVHHVNKADNVGRRAGSTLRGTSAFWGWYDAAMFVKRTDEEIEVSFEARYCADQPRLKLRLDIDTDHIVPSAKFVEIDQVAGRSACEQRVLDALQGKDSMSKEDLKKAVNRNGGDVQKALTALIADGIVGARGQGKGAVYYARPEM